MSKTPNSYKKLFSNTIIFAIGSFSSKFLVFLLLPLYTRTLNPSDFGTVDLMIQIANLMLPIATLSIADSMIRFGLDKRYKKTTVFSCGIVINLVGILIIGLSLPFLMNTSYVGGYGWLFFCYVAFASIKLVMTEFVRAKGLVKLYAFTGLLTTFMMIVLNVVFLVVLKIGIIGYLLAIILSDLVSLIFVFFMAELYRNLKLTSVNKKVVKQMLAFSIPLIPTAIMWWVTNVSDRFLVTSFLGKDANGLYTIAYKIPTIITTIYAMFNQAWNMSAITERDSKGRKRFYTNVFSSNESMMYVLAGAIMVVLMPLTKILVSDEYFVSYKFAPLLIIATVFTCFTSFLGGIYAAKKKSVHSFVTSLFGAVLNIVLNLLLIPVFGINGASFATLVSYLLVFIIRMMDIQQFSPFGFLPGKVILNTAILTSMAFWIMLIDNVVFLYVALIIGFIIILLLNFTVLMKSFKKVLPTRVLKLLPFLN